VLEFLKAAKNHGPTHDDARRQQQQQNEEDNEREGNKQKDEPFSRTTEQ